MRYFVAFSYFGKSYHGWQRQPNAITVQQLLEEAFSTLLRQPVSLVGAGRTDTGVHARQMIAHMDIEKKIRRSELIHRLNAFLPDDIAVQDIFKVPTGAHARFDALERTYEYWLVTEKNPFYKDTAHYLRGPLELDKMNQAAQLLLQHEDFQCFSKSGSDVKTYNCQVRKAAWTRVGDRLVFTISADRFLRNMVRAVVGTLLEVGKGKLQPDDVKGIIKSGDRGKAGVSVPAKGLYLTRVSYPVQLLANASSAIATG